MVDDEDLVLVPILVAGDHLVLLRDDAGSVLNGPTGGLVRAVTYGRSRPGTTARSVTALQNRRGDPPQPDALVIVAAYAEEAAADPVDRILDGLVP